MLINLNKMAAYVCPYCCEISTENLSLFEISGSGGLTLACHTEDCGESCVYLKYKNGKYSVRIECPICGDIHTFTLSKETLVYRPVTVLKCPVSDIDIFFFGEGNQVLDAVNKSADTYGDVIPSILENKNEILEIMTDRIEELFHNGDITCECGSDHIRYDISKNSIDFTCAKCSRKKSIEICAESLMVLLNASAIIIR